jgi:cytochrome c oxidase assembly protein subunit 15
MGNVVLRWPLAIAVLHNAGAAALVLTLVVINYRTAQTKPGSRFPVRAQFAAT